MSEYERLKKQKEDILKRQSDSKIEKVKNLIRYSNLPVSNLDQWALELAKQIDALYTERAGENKLCVDCPTLPKCEGSNIGDCERSSHPDPPAVSDLMLNSEDIETSLLNNLLINVHHGIPDTQMRKFKAIAEAQLAKVQPRITELENKIAELEAAIEQFENNDPTGLQAYYLKKAREMKP